MSQSANKVEFISISEFKEKTGVKSFKVLKNPKTGKLFLSLDNGETMRCQGNFDPSKPSQFIMDRDEDTTIMDACFINYDDSKGAEEIASF